MSVVRASYQYYLLTFKRPAQTSRGTLHVKHTWIIEIEQNLLRGRGECSVIPGLSPDFIDFETYNQKIKNVVHQLNSEQITEQNAPDLLKQEPSILFGVESAFLDLKNGGQGMYFDNSFSRGRSKIPINGLIWMGDEQFVRQQIEEKISAGFSTLKLKISAQTWDTDRTILQSIRDKYDKRAIVLRVDANGSFSVERAKKMLEELHRLDVHSIEQPIATKQRKEMQYLCSTSPISIALDEELIGINNYKDKVQLLSDIQPQFIILKPSLHGGISGTQQWIELAQKQGVGWWMTSALESNIGLKTIGDFTAEYNNLLPQGLGTGQLYQNNFETKLQVSQGYLRVYKMKKDLHFGLI